MGFDFKRRGFWALADTHWDKRDSELGLGWLHFFCGRNGLKRSGQLVVKDGIRLVMISSLNGIKSIRNSKTASFVRNNRVVSQGLNLKRGIRFLTSLPFSRLKFFFFTQTLKPVSALVIVDVQNDFITGSLSLCRCPARQDGAEVVPVINQLLENVPFDLVIYTKDWHPENHISFIENVNQRPLSENCKVTKLEIHIIFLQ